MLLVLQRRGPHHRAGAGRDVRGVRTNRAPRRRSAQRGGRARSSPRAARAVASSCSTGSAPISPDSPTTRRSACSSSVSRRSRTASGSTRPRSPLATSCSTRSAPALAADADHLSTWFLHDPDPWDGQPHPARRAAAPGALRARTPAGGADDRRRAGGHRAAARSGVEGGRVAPRCGACASMLTLSRSTSCARRASRIAASRRLPISISPRSGRSTRAQRLVLRSSFEKRRFVPIS